MHEVTPVSSAEKNKFENFPNLRYNNFTKYETLFILIYDKGVEELPFLQWLMDTPTRYPTATAFCSADLLPDMCATCYTFLGTSVGGRLRHVCPVCREADNEQWRKVGLFTLALGLPTTYADAILTQLLYKHKAGLVLARNKPVTLA
jgi:hypothetical protein